MPTPVPTHDPRIVALPAAEIRRRFVDFFAERGHTVVPSASLVPAGDQTLLFTNSGHGPVQGRPDRRRDALVQARRRLPALPARRRQAQRLRGGRPDAAPPHASSRCSATGASATTSSARRSTGRWDFLTKDLGIPGERLAATTYKDDEVARQIWRDEIGLPPERMASLGRRRHRRRQQLLADGRHRSVRAVQRDPLRPRARALRGPALHPRPQRDTARAGSRSGTSSSWSSTSARRARAAAVHERRHRAGPRAPGERPPAGPDQLRHRPVPADPRPDARAARPRPGRLREPSASATRSSPTTPAR